MTEEDQYHEGEYDEAEYEEDEMGNFDPEQMTEEQLEAYYNMYGHLPDGYLQEEVPESEGAAGGDEQEEEHHQISQSGSPMNVMNDSPSQEEELDEGLLFRQVKRELLEQLNDNRSKRKIGQFYTDLMGSLIADQYANYLIDYEHDHSVYQGLLIRHKYFGDQQMIYIISKFEEDTYVSSEVMYDYFMEIGNLFLEVDGDKQLLIPPESTEKDKIMNHIAIGVRGNREQIVIVYILSKRDMAVFKVEDGPENFILVHGKMLNEEVGVYALQILPSTEDPKPNDKNEHNKVGPESIKYDKIKKEFIAKINNQGAGNCTQDFRYYIDLYTRNTPDSIPYEKQTREKLKLNNFLSQKLRIPVIAFPDPKYAHEEQLNKRKQEEELALQAQQIQLENEKKSESEPSQDNDDQASGFGVEPGDFMPKKQDIPKENQISNKEILEELDSAIKEAQRQHDELYQHNLNLQAKIKQLRNRQDIYVDKTGETTMNEHKYLNTLAHVHQIRIDLKQTEDRYNQMANDLQQKLDEKSRKCNEIKQAFMALKREVAQKAAFSRTGKPIPERQIKEWEDQEMEKNKSLQELRLDTLRLKNNLAKNQKQLKKKEELAEGLHLIDFEQLKIENQTLNEKIEERTEDLHKLKNKNTKTLQILTHTKEKLGFVKQKFQIQENQNNSKKSELDQFRKQLAGSKVDNEKLRLENLKLKQQTGIINRPDLINDYLSRKDRIKNLEEEQLNLESQLRHMQTVIDKYNAHMKAQTDMKNKAK